MEEQNNTVASVEAPVIAATTEQPAVDAAPKKKVTRSRKKVVAPEAKEEIGNEATPTDNQKVEPAVNNKKKKQKEAPKAEKKDEAEEKKTEAEKKAEEKTAAAEKPAIQTKPAAAEKTATQAKPVAAEKPANQEKPASQEKPAAQEKPQQKPIPKMPQNLVIRDFCDLANQGSRIPLLTDQQIQQLTYEDAYNRNLILEAVLANVLDYDIVLSDTNIWLELLVGHTSSHSDPKVNARLMFERQLEFISKMAKKIGGKFMIMSETYEEVDRFATMQEPVDYKVADWKDEVLCRNVAARLAKRLMLSQQKENSLRIEGIG